MSKLTRTHTPGPWYATGIHVQSASLNEDNYVCRADGVSIKQAEANARMIAAAPELLAALRLMQKALAEAMPGVRHIACQDYAILNDAPIAAARAIAKATGKGKHEPV